MLEGYYCLKCKKFVLTSLGLFQHPHLGNKTCLYCRRCGGMVYLKEQEV
ncbi:unnamed protein product [marine sediment metagenome]|uniref:Uncharacterized protein n=1 Tax=marine sediment metagenome TaxID=412755 RepID=X1GGH4_9ZZZZ